MHVVYLFVATLVSFNTYAVQRQQNAIRIGGWSGPESHTHEKPVNRKSRTVCVSGKNNFKGTKNKISGRQQQEAP